MKKVSILLILTHHLIQLLRIFNVLKSKNLKQKNTFATDLPRNDKKYSKTKISALLKMAETQVYLKK